MMKFKSQTMKNLKLVLAPNQCFTCMFRNLTSLYLLLVDLIESVVHLIVFGFHIISEDGNLVGNDETNNYQETIVGLEVDKWKDVMDREIHSMYDY